MDFLVYISVEVYIVVICQTLCYNIVHACRIYQLYICMQVCRVHLSMETS